MIRAPRDHSVSELEPFFAAERELIAEPEDLRNRVLERARTSVQHVHALPFAQHAQGVRRVKIGLLAAAAVMFSGICALAFLAGYHVKNRRTESLSNPVIPGASVQAPQVPSIVVAIVPLPVPGDPAASGEPAASAAHSEVAKTPGTGAMPMDLEAYTKELRVLQPARQAVARQDYGSALAAIAEHNRQFPAGRLSEEREALRVKALLGLGRTAEAKRAGATFHARFPRSALNRRIDQMLSE